MGERLGEGATSRVWAAEAPDGAALAVKVASPSHTQDLVNEAERLAFALSLRLPRVHSAGRLGERVPGFEDLAGAPWIALDRARGVAVDPTKLKTRERVALALGVARDVGEALADLHASGSAHGDVKPANVVVERGPHGLRAHLVDLGLSSASNETVPRGATLRYLAPEVFEGGARGDARARDLWALGVTIAEIADARVAGTRDIASAFASFVLEPAVEGIVRPLLTPTPGARPSAEWVRRRALAELDVEEPDTERAARHRRAVERAYLSTRRRELVALASHANVEIRVGGEPGLWLRRVRELLHDLARLREEASSSKPGAFLGDLDAFGRARFLTGLIGAPAADWPRVTALDDAALVERLLDLTRRSDPRALSFHAVDTGRREERSTPRDPVAVAVALGEGSSDPSLLDHAEASCREHPILGLTLGRVFRLRGEAGRSLAVLARVGGAEAELEAAEVLRRSGDPERARTRAEGVTIQDAALASRRAAILARITLDRGDVDGALAWLRDVHESAAVAEVRALAELAQNDPDAALRTLENASSLAERPEEHARLVAVRGSIFHARGDAARALPSFRVAVDHALRSGAVLEEATYLTGLAACAADLGSFREALDASRRAILLFEHLGRPREAGRAALARTAVYAQAGALTETLDAALDAMARARALDDRRCRAYLHLAMADVLPEADADAGEHADRALGLLAEAGPDDRLRAAARQLVRGRELNIGELDGSARRSGAALDARGEWWGARARVLARAESPERADAVLAELSELLVSALPVGIRGPSFAHAARLARRVGDGERARRFAAAARDALLRMAANCPPELGQAIRGLPWAAELALPADEGVSNEQIADVEALVHALGGRDRLRPLLERVLDALILWTGVERGLLLLSAPGDKLVPRAARNLAKADLSGDQLALSRSLAERALTQREPVIAVDAAGELPELCASVHALKLRSVLAVPLLARGQTLGVVYLDDRIRRGAFGQKEIAWVKLLATIAAVAIADARDQLLLRRAARRARRAEGRLAVELSRREAELDVAERELARARDARDTRFQYSSIVGESDALRSLLATLDRVASSEVPVLVIGESGSGKELVARAIHEHGPRAKERFVTENCGAIPEPLLESTLFGHVRGAFTGAARARAGLFEVADRGTLFLDEIGEMSLAMQTKLLRVLENGEVHALGAERPRRVDVRVIGATHRDLQELVAQGKFRQDLLYRLDVITLRVPPLRERRADIPLLVRHFVEKHRAGKSVRLTREALDRLSAFAWPGNIRQLENEVRRALVLSDDVVDAEHLSPEIVEASGRPRPAEDELGLRARVDALELELVEKALKKTHGNQTRAAELLGLSRFGLQKMMKRLGAEPSSKPGRRAAMALGKQR